MLNSMAAQQIIIRRGVVSDQPMNHDAVKTFDEIVAPFIFGEVVGSFNN